MRLIVIVILLVFTPPTWAKPTELECLAQNIYYEARGEPPLGKLLVAKVTLNRVNHPHFPKTICAVVFQPHQFSWTSKRHTIKDKQAYQESLELAHLILHSGVLNLLPDTVLYFHAVHVHPKWPFKKLVQIGNHIFYA